MSDATMAVSVVSPERVLFSGESTQVITRILGSGEIAFLPGHAPLIGALTENHTRIYLADGLIVDVAVHGGFVEVSNNKVNILSDVAELADNIDRRTGPARPRTCPGSDKRADDEENAEAVASFARAMARVNATGGLGTSSSH